MPVPGTLPLTFTLSAWESWKPSSSARTHSSGILPSLKTNFMWGWNTVVPRLVVTLLVKACSVALLSNFLARMAPRNAAWSFDGPAAWVTSTRTSVASSGGSVNRNSMVSPARATLLARPLADNVMARLLGMCLAVGDHRERAGWLRSQER